MADKAKRVMLSPAERVAKLEAELATARAKAEARANRETDLLLEKRTKLLGRIEKLEQEVDAIDLQLGLISADETTVEDEHLVLENQV